MLLMRVSIILFLCCCLLPVPQCRAGTASSDLLSSRCQAMCLTRLENTAKDKGLTRRQLKHSIIATCKTDDGCSSCASPCQELFESVERCKRLHCKSVKSRKQCRESCEFLNVVYTHKPGECPSRKDSLMAAECVQSCRMDGECQQTQKCCSNGCGQTCAWPDTLPHSLLPIPVGVTIKERKRGRSAVVRWTMKGLLEQHVQTFANLYVVQWRWGVKKDEGRMTRWQTITVRNKPYAILKHLLSPGRYYRFRIAAVSVKGSAGFSSATALFRLSKQAKAPGRPADLRLADGGRLNLKGMYVGQKIEWKPPPSDLPIVHYRVSWALERIRGLQQQRGKAARQIQRDMAVFGESANTTATAPPQENDSFGGNYQSEIVSARYNSVELDALRPNARYVVQVNAIAEGEDDELPGSKATIYVDTPNLGRALLSSVLLNAEKGREPTQEKTATTTNIPPSSTNSDKKNARSGSGQNQLIYDVDVEEPYFQNGLLKATLSWKIHRGILDENSEVIYDLNWVPTVCLSSSGGSGQSLRPIKAVSRETKFQLFDMLFGCKYVVNVSALVEKAGSSSRSPPPVRFVFETPRCADTAVRGKLKPKCPKQIPDVPLAPRNLRCSVSAAGGGGSPNITALCHWDAPALSDAPITDYRLLCAQADTDRPGTNALAAIDKNTVVIRSLPASRRKLLLASLLAETAYVVQVHAVSDVGQSAAASTRFMTPVVLVSRKKASSANSREHGAGMVYQTETNTELIHELEGRLSGQKHDRGQTTNNIGGGQSVAVSTLQQENNASSNSSHAGHLSLLSPLLLAVTLAWLFNT